jgi:mannose-6-phosphate isomerase-like protein (cupin superfamily)
MLRSIKLPFEFDPASLRSDLDKVRPDEWIRHFNREYHDGGWMGVALRSRPGSSNALVVAPHAHLEFVDTDLLNRCPAVRAVLRMFQCPVGSVRFLKLVPGAKIREHRDDELTPESGQARVHVPIVTNSQVEFFLDAERVEMQPGECWYLNFSLPHWIENHGTTDRVHLVIDCQLNDWLQNLLPLDESAESEVPNCPSSSAELERFRLRVLSDMELQHRLRQTSDRGSFARLVVREARARGFCFALEDTVEALALAQQSWHERWVG